MHRYMFQDIYEWAGKIRTINIEKEEPVLGGSEAQGIPIDRTIFENNSVYVRTALVAYSAVFHDLGDLSKKEYLERIIRDSLKPSTASGRNK